MVTHVVLFTLKDPHDIDRTVQILRSLAGRVPGLRAIEVGAEALPNERSAHIALTTCHDSWDALAAYHHHPAHQKVLAHMGRVVERSVKVDYES